MVDFVHLNKIEQRETGDRRRRRRRYEESSVCTVVGKRGCLDGPAGDPTGRPVVRRQSAAHVAPTAAVRDVTDAV
jgi:hypothetical protein